MCAQLIKWIDFERGDGAEPGVGDWRGIPQGGGDVEGRAYDTGRISSEDGPQSEAH